MLLLFFSMSFIYARSEVLADNQETVVKTGKCGKNVNYKVIKTKSTFLWDCYKVIITGSGPMFDYMDDSTESYNVIDFKSSAPWTEVGSNYIEEVEISEGVTRIGNYAFAALGNAYHINLPSSLTEIGDYSFALCRRWNDKISIPSGVTKIGRNAFSACGKITGDIVIPKGVETIEDETFISCKKISSFRFEGQLKSIGSRAFSECASISQIVMPESLNSIGDNAFNSCEVLAMVVLSDNITEIGESAFSFCPEIKEINIPQNIIKIPKGMLYGAESLVAIEIPNSVLTIGSDAFGECGLESVTIPASVNMIGYGAFGGNSSLKKVVFEGFEPMMETESSFYEYIFPDTIIDGYHPVNWQSAPEEEYHGGKFVWHNTPSIKLPLDKNRTKKETLNIKVKYKDGATKKVYTQKAKYKDQYFFETWNITQGALIKLSMLASSAAYNESYARKLMKDCHFTVISSEYIKSTKNDNDHVSYMIGTKMVEGITIFAVFIKGTSGDYEWISNFNVEREGDHEGFVKAKKEVLYTLYNDIHIKNAKDNKIKIWVVGHSRGAAVANLLAKDLTDKFGKNCVYAYTYATPRVSIEGKTKGYKNIRNYLNPGDFVTEVPPIKWSYKRYGRDIVLDDSKYDEMRTNFKKITGITYEGFSAAEKNSLVKAFLSYCGSSVYSYYLPHTNGIAPVEYCQYGLGLVLANDSDGISNLLLYSASDVAAANVTRKMVTDGKLNNKFPHAHCQTSYYAWLKAMYP